MLLVIIRSLWGSFLQAWLLWAVSVSVSPPGSPEKALCRQMLLEHPGGGRARRRWGSTPWFPREESAIEANAPPPVRSRLQLSELPWLQAPLLCIPELLPYSQQRGLGLLQTAPKTGSKRLGMTEFGLAGHCQAQRRRNDSSAQLSVLSLGLRETDFCLAGCWLSIYWYKNAPKNLFCFQSLHLKYL